MRIAALQMTSGLDAEANVIRALSMISAAADSGAELIVLPESFARLADRDAALSDIAEPFGDGPIQESVRFAAEKNGIWIAAGSIPVRSGDNGRFTDTTIVFNPAGEAAFRYDRVHLFSRKLSEEDIFCQEREKIDAGTTAGSFELINRDGEKLRVGVGIGFDLRFPEHFRAMATPDLILLPAAFTAQTGRAHWAALLAARAIENQCFVAAAAQSGQHECGRTTWGHTRVLDAWGSVLAEIPSGEGAAICDLELARLSSVRRMLPALACRVDE
ncbi:nitrilase-related carbon-nitrogen hydrolase [Sutterella sp.]|uniref:nitrilase-related carbon-nitrogen hydrolase n=1 Tax=Sutterella sp. TaxID=1981025 RepID=UPI0026DEC1B5|nr:nitrilase-related carbon-nitrogen hydrolase [Sutterella sp.]MDO5530655.1 nitrilase-related carbon-nitrogen hydrolase [Sutterella sp.]